MGEGKIRTGVDLLVAFGHPSHIRPAGSVQMAQGVRPSLETLLLNLDLHEF